MTNHEIERLLGRLDRLAQSLHELRTDLAAVLVGDEPPPRRKEADLDAVEAVIQRSGKPWSCDQIARSAHIPTHRAREALRRLIDRGDVAAYGRTRGMRYRWTRVGDALDGG